MSNYTESKYKFHFDDRWQILKYDDHPYYRIVSGRSFSGIDFAGIFENKHLYLIEVKNFYQFDNKGEIENVDQFVLEMKEKVLDSIDLIEIINKYHQRKWTYRFLKNLILRFPTLNKDWWFWTRMYELVKAESMIFVLLIESKVNMNSLRVEILSSLEGEGYVIPKLIIQSLNEASLDGLEVFEI